MNKTQVNKMMEECLFPDTCENSSLLETHISWVVLTDQFAFKIKRPVKHSFLDFYEKKEWSNLFYNHYQESLGEDQDEPLV